MLRTQIRGRSLPSTQRILSGGKRAVEGSLSTFRSPFYPGKRGAAGKVSALGLGLVMTAAVAHALWNFLLKRAGQGTPFLWVISVVGAVVYAPIALALVMWERPQVTGMGFLIMGLSSLIHVTYLMTLQHGFRVGDFSLVYPIARGTGPVLTAIFAVLLLGERPTLLAAIGIGLVAVGTVTLSGVGGRRPGEKGAGSTRVAVGFGLLTGLLIASYTLVDKYAVSVVLVPPLLLEWFSNASRALVLTPTAVKQWPQVQTAWKKYRLEAMGIGILSPLAYLLVLIAMTFTPVSYVAPAREMSILIGALIGSKVLAEGAAFRRVAGAAAIVAGVFSLAFG